MNAMRRQHAQTGEELVNHTSAGQLYGRNTELAMQNLRARGRGMRQVPEFLSAYALVKAAAAKANLELGCLPTATADAIVQAAAEVTAGAHSAQFPLPLLQGGGGTSANMNLNEVLATRATELLREAGQFTTIHPNDHVNRSQSTNDTYPTAMAITLFRLARGPLDALTRVEDSLRDLAARYGDTQRLGRTCLQDAVPLSIRDTHLAQARAVGRVRAELGEVVTALSQVPLGATAVGTGIGAPPGYADAAVRHLAELTGHNLVTADDPFDMLAHLDPYAKLASAASRTAIVLAKIASDLRFLSSGPRAGIAEVTLPPLQPGSSIMPGKVNPIIPEQVLQLSFRVRGCAHTVELAVSAGELELNVMEPVILDALVTALSDVEDAAVSLSDKCLRGLRWNTDVVDEHLQASLGGLVTMAAETGYEGATAFSART